MRTWDHACSVVGQVAAPVTAAAGGGNLAPFGALAPVACCICCCCRCCWLAGRATPSPLLLPSLRKLKAEGLCKSRGGRGQWLAALPGI